MTTHALHSRHSETKDSQESVLTKWNKILFPGYMTHSYHKLSHAISNFINFALLRIVINYDLNTLNISLCPGRQIITTVMTSSFKWSYPKLRKLMELYVTIRLIEMVASNMMGEALVDHLKTINSCANSDPLALWS